MQVHKVLFNCVFYIALHNAAEILIVCPKANEKASERKRHSE